MSDVDTFYQGWVRSCNVELGCYLATLLQTLWHYTGEEAHTVFNRFASVDCNDEPYVIRSSCGSVFDMHGKNQRFS